MIDKIIKFFVWLFFLVSNDPKKFPPDVRLFNFVNLFNGVVNIVGIFHQAQLLGIDNPNIFMSFFTGIIFLILWALSRFEVYPKDKLFWPFFFTMMVFLGVSWFYNNGSTGGNHYYFLLATMIMAIVAARSIQILISTLLTCLIYISLVLAEFFFPYLILQSHFSNQLYDRTSQYLFVILCISLLTFVLVKTLFMEKALTDRMLHNILPSKIANELRTKGTSMPVRYQDVTVIFMDMVGFSKLVLNMQPEQVVKLLDYYFNIFDRCFKNYNVEKIKTLGDGYMAVSGLPVPTTLHAHNAMAAVKAILEIVNSEKEIAHRKEKNLETIQIRVGMNSGSVIAGVIGNNKFTYDIWGNTVNLASRMETSSLPNRVCVSSSTYEILKSNYNFSYLGKLMVKNMGEVDAYILDNDEFDAEAPDNKISVDLMAQAKAESLPQRQVETVSENKHPARNETPLNTQANVTAKENISSENTATVETSSVEINLSGNKKSYKSSAEKIPPTKPQQVQPLSETKKPADRELVEIVDFEFANDPSDISEPSDMPADSFLFASDESENDFINFSESEDLIADNKLNNKNHSKENRPASSDKTQKAKMFNSDKGFVKKDKTDIEDDLEDDTDKDTDKILSNVLGKLL